MYIEELYLKGNLWETYRNIDNKTGFILDSSLVNKELGRYSFMGLSPQTIFRTKGNQIELIENERITIWSADPLKTLDDILNNYVNTNINCPFPFCGGLVGYISYDLKNQIEKLPENAVDDTSVYDQYWGIYNTFLVQDNITQKIYLASYSKKEAKSLKQIVNELVLKKQNSYCYIGEFKSNFTQEEYTKAVEKAKEYIRIGDIYQVNLSQRFNFEIKGNSKYFYDILRDVNPAYFGAYLNFPEYDIMSISPERFLKITDNIIETRPIKGTRGRGTSSKEDLKIIQELQNSEKDRAELLMIVDLMRNDIGRISKTGSVKVQDLFKINKYRTLFHLDAIITGKIKPQNNNYQDILKATFPGGSITGAPKIKSMKIIDEIEPNTRGVYTGSIGYIDYRKNCDLNIAIRTAVIKDDIGYYSAGGGIVSDSDPKLEYEETWVKTKALQIAKKEANKSVSISKWRNN